MEKSLKNNGTIKNLCQRIKKDFYFPDSIGVNSNFSAYKSVSEKY
jgi:hypothetical protein